MLCVEDYLDVLGWVEEIGGLSTCITRANESLSNIENWIEQSDFFDFLCNNIDYRSNTSVCLKFKKEEIINKGEEWQRKFAKEIGLFLEKEEVAFDIVNHRSAPPGLRIWTGATVESSDVEKLLPWIDWAYKQALTNIDSN